VGLDTVELVLGIEDHFEINIPDEDAGKMSTAGDIYEYILKALSEKRKAVVPEPAKEVVWDQLVKLIVDLLGVEPKQVTKQARIVKDLGAD